MIDNQELKLILYTEEGRAAIRHLDEATDWLRKSEFASGGNRTRRKQLGVAHIHAAKLLLNYKIEEYRAYCKKEGLYKDFY